MEFWQKVGKTQKKIKKWQTKRTEGRIVDEERKVKLLNLQAKREKAKAEVRKHKSKHRLQMSMGTGSSYHSRPATLQSNPNLMPGMPGVPGAKPKRKTPKKQYKRKIVIYQ